MKLSGAKNAAATIVLFLPLLLIAQLTEFRAVKLTNVDSDVLASHENIASGMEYLESINLNAVLVVVWNSSGSDGDHTLYPSAVMDSLFGRPIHPAYVNRDPLAEVITEAHLRGIEVFPWFEMGFSTSYSQNGGYILDTYPDWALEDVNGNLMVKNGFDWMSAINPEVQDFIMALTLEVVDNYDVDGIEYSDRIPAMPVEGGYDAVTVDIYRSEHDGANPPSDHDDTNWKRWRADKLSSWMKSVYDSVKVRGSDLIVSSSPSLYPWSYHEYLQDPKTWVDSGYVDTNIPQLYRYEYSGTGGYLYELEQALGYHPANQRETFFAGMLVKVGNYRITPEFLLQSLTANRSHNVNGEALFFYEGLREENDLIGTTLLENHYAEPARMPGRQGNNWRPPGIVVNETDPGATLVGDWTPSSGIGGYESSVLLHSSAEAASIRYSFDVPVSAYYQVYSYLITGPLASGNFVVFSQSDTLQFQPNMHNTYHRGWYELSSVYLEAGTQTVLELNNEGIDTGQMVPADAAMIMIDRKLSPEVQYAYPSGLINPSQLPNKSKLITAFPNPFNGETTLNYYLPESGSVHMKLYNIKGQEIWSSSSYNSVAGPHRTRLTLKDQESGNYFIVIEAQGYRSARKLLLIK